MTMKMVTLVCNQCAMAITEHDEELHVTAAWNPGFVPGDYGDEPGFLVCPRWGEEVNKLPDRRRMECEMCKSGVSVTPSSFWLLGIEK